ncbi:MAG TPA: enolase C-terminal domain-like protein [Ilumatobacteraceae bacterium]|nr:enolase C-terminal domain-like protein [Ilumatobacteraceae bacterium]
MPDVMHDVARLEPVPIEHALTVPFAIAGGGMDTARAVIVRVELIDGAIGLGECAPFPAVSGETVESSLAALQAVEQHGAAALATAPAARCGLEQALLDARLRAAGRSVLDWMPPAAATIETDLTLPVGPLDRALAFVDDAVRQGFRTLKVKVGGHALADDAALVTRIHAAFPGLELLLDGNAAYDLDAARELLRLLADVPIALLEQPLPRDDLDGAATLQAGTDVVVCLDESLRTVADLDAILRRPILRSINVKTMKLGLEPAVEVLRRAADAGLSCMVGGMVESRLSMTISAALAMHRPDVVRHVDLDTPLFMRPGPIAGGIVYDGPTISMPPGIVGHGCSLR